MEGAIKKKYLLSSVDKSLKVLDLLSVRDNLGVAEISKILNLDKTSVFKILYTLENRDYIFRTAETKYRLGVKFANYGSLVTGRQSIIEIAKPSMQKLRSRCHETVYLSILNFNNRVIIMHREEGDSEKSINTRIGYELDPHCTAMGKVLLAYLDEANLRRTMDGFQFKVYCPATIHTKEALYLELDQVKRQGFADDSDERYAGHSATAAPLHDSSRQCVATVSIVCSTASFLQNRDSFHQQVLRTADEISHNLGYIKPGEPA